MPSPSPRPVRRSPTIPPTIPEPPQPPSPRPTDPCDERGVVAVTGATGFVGGHVARRLHADGWRVRVLVRKPGPGSAFASTITGSLEHRESLERLVESVDAVVHCAGLVRAASAAEFHAVNEDGVARLAAAAATLKTPPRFILISSLAAREAELSSYGASKRCGERALASHGGGLPWTVVRPPAVYGPGDKATLDFFRLYARGLALTPGGPGGRLSLIHGEDLAGAVAALVASDIGVFESLEVRDGCAEGYSWADVAAAAGRCFGRPMTLISPPRALIGALAAINQAGQRLIGAAPRLTPGKVRELYHPDWVACENPIAESTSWRPRMTIDEGFAQTIAWYRAEGWL